MSFLDKFNTVMDFRAKVTPDPIGTPYNDNDAKMDSFFSILNERERQYFTAKARYEEALNNFERILQEKRNKFGEKLEKPQVIPTYPFKVSETVNEIGSIKKQKTKKYTRRSNSLNKNTLKKDIINVLKDRGPMHHKNILLELIKNGRKFSAKRPTDVVYQEIVRWKDSAFIKNGKQWCLK